MNSSKIALTKIVVIIVTLLGIYSTSTSFAQGANSFEVTQRTLTGESSQKASSQSVNNREMLRVIKNSASNLLIEEANTLLGSQTQQAIANKFAGTAKAIESGKEQSFMVNMTTNPTVVEGHAVKVNISYDQRPIGGILNVKVELMPKFVGIGVAPRAIAKKMLATAVDNLNDAEVSKIIAEMTKEIAQEIAMAN